MKARVCSVDRGGPGNLNMVEHDLGVDPKKSTRVTFPADSVVSIVAVDGDLAVGIGDTIVYLGDGRMHSMHTTAQVDVVFTPESRIAVNPCGQPVKVALDWCFDPSAGGGRQRAFCKDPETGGNWDLRVYADGSWEVFDPRVYTPAHATGRERNEGDAKAEALRALERALR